VDPFNTGGTGKAQGLPKPAGTDLFATGYRDEILRACRQHTSLPSVSRNMQTYRRSPGGATLNAKRVLLNNLGTEADKNLEFSEKVGDNMCYVNLKFLWVANTTSGLAGN